MTKKMVEPKTLKAAEAEAASAAGPRPRILFYRAPVKAPNKIMNDRKGVFPPGESMGRLHCGNVVITGYLFEASGYLAICLTEPCAAIYDDRLVVAEPNEVVLLRLESGLKALLTWATHPTEALLLSIQPCGQSKGVRRWMVVQYGKPLGQERAGVRKFLRVRREVLRVRQEVEFLKARYPIAVDFHTGRLEDLCSGCASMYGWEWCHQKGSCLGGQCFGCQHHFEFLGKFPVPLDAKPFNSLEIAWGGGCSASDGPLEFDDDGVLWE